MRNFAFVLEQTLGHVAHSRNIERALAQEREIDATVIRLEFRRASGLGQLPGLRTWSFQASLSARRALKRRLRRGPVEAVFIHTQVAALLSAEVMRAVPTVVSLDATPLNFDQEGEAYGHRRGGHLVESLKLRLNQRALKQAAALVAWCRWTASSLVADYGIPESRIRVIPPGVDTGLFRPAERRRAGHVRVLFVGGDFERKGGRDLLEAFRRLGHGYTAELDVVTGGAVTGIPAGLSCRVHRGLAPQSPELVRLYHEADVFALPSRGDCMPQAVAEALASGLPILATGVGAIPEMVAQDVNGFLVAPGDVRALAIALEGLVGSPQTRADFGRRSRLVAEQAHDADRNNRAVFAMMAQLADDSARGLRTA